MPVLMEIMVSTGEILGELLFFQRREPIQQNLLHIPAVILPHLIGQYSFIGQAY